MALVNKAFSVSVTPSQMPPVVHVSEYDIGRSYTVTINGENGEAFTIPTGAAATIEGTLNNKVGFSESATIDGNTVSFSLTESMTAYSGKAWCKIKLTLNDEPIQTCAFVLNVDRAGVEAETVISAPGFTDVIDDAVENYMEQRGVDVDPEQLAQAVDDYFDEHPVVVDETDPTVPAWAKQPTKPTYTAQEVGALPSDTPIPTAVTEQTVAGWGFTKNTGTYSKPSGGIPKTDLASAVQTSLGKADTALQQHQSLTGYATETWVEGKGYQTAQQAAAAAPVQSVNGKTGAVTLKTSDLRNDSGFITAQDVPAAPVQSVNSKTGAVTVREVPDAGGATVGQVLTKTADGLGWTTPAGGGDLPDYSHAIDGQVLTKTQHGPRWADNTPSSGAALRLLYDGTFGPDDPELMLIGNVADAETGNAIATALVSGRIGSAVLVDVTDPNTEVVYDLFAVGYDAQTHVSTVTFARTEDALIRTATLSGSTKTAPVFGTIPLGGLPAVTASDNGKFLRVVNGAWAAQTVPAAEGSAF